MDNGFEDREEYESFKVKRLPLAYPEDNDQRADKKPPKVYPDKDHRLINREGTAALEKRMNKAASRYYHAKDGEQARALAFEVMALAAQVYEVRERGELVGIDDAFMATLTSTLKNFDPQMGEYSHYFKNTYTYRRADGVDAWEDIDTHQHRSATELNDEHEQMRARLLADEALIELFQLVDGFLSHKSSGTRALSPKRDLYTRLFFTETVTIVVKLRASEHDCATLEMHERDTMRCMKLDFLDTYMEAPCQTMRQIWRTKVREECGTPEAGYSVISGKAWKLAEWVFQEYLESAHGIADSRNSVLNRRKEYKDTFMGEISILA